MVALFWRRAGALLVFLLGVTACVTEKAAVRPERDIVSRTQITGTVNGSPVVGEVSATLHTGRGGRSICRYSELPAGFTPATIGTHG